jgi:hypothetical protein
MGMKNGSSLSLRVFYVIRQIDEKPFQVMQDEAPPPANTVGVDGVSYWTDVHKFAGYQLATLRFASRKVSKALLDAETKREVEAYERATEQKLGRPKKAEIRADIMKRLLPDAPIITRDIEAVWKVGDHYIYTTATSETAATRFQNRWLIATQSPAMQLYVDEMVKLVAGTDIRQCPCAQLSPDRNVLAPTTMEHGPEFLTWLWYRLEKHLRVDNKQGMVDPPLLLMGGSDDGQIRICGGRATLAVETAKALESGKLLYKGKFILDMGDELPMSLTLDPSLCMRQVAVPKGEAMVDPAGNFQTRMTRIEDTWDWLQRAVGAYGIIRSSCDAWQNEAKAIRNWVRGKVGRPDEEVEL